MEFVAIISFALVVIMVWGLIIYKILTEKPDPQTQKEPQDASAAPTSTPMPLATPPIQANYSPPSETTSIDVLQFLAWLNLIGGVMGAVYLFATVGTYQTPGSYRSEINPYGVLLASSALASGVAGCVIMLVLARMARGIEKIGRLLERER